MLILLFIYLFIRFCYVEKERTTIKELKGKQN